MLPLQHRYATVMSADVAGYSRLIWDDAGHAIESLFACQAQIHQLIADFGGRLVDFTGDNLLAEFSSEMPALQCACAVQRALAVFNRGRMRSKQLRFRIGLHAGRILTHNDRLYGTTVNLASRLQTAAPIGGLLVSGAFAERAGNQEILTRGHDRTFKNIPTLVETWAVPAERFNAE
ncbi:MAG TPA: adenylate/guanylate cyclase domain-containing protein [Polyangiales bacterium]|jgi:adenylate cyclase|nr:adenylate/guanylate cyclase domain-containing protein [Polyangiales bacterium]